MSEFHDWACEYDLVYNLVLLNEGSIQAGVTKKPEWNWIIRGRREYMTIT